MKRIKLGLKILAVLAIALYPLIVAQLVFAIDPPDNDPSVDDIHANRNLIVSGDVLIYGRYSIPYATLPDVPADEAFIFRLIDTDGTTELGQTVPFVKFDNGYNEGVFSFYFESGLTWGELYIVRISQNPAHFATPVSIDYVMPSSAYTSETTQIANQTELAIYVLLMAEEMESYYTTYDFLEASAGGTVLSDPTGETYFRGAIYGLQAMAPDLFLVQVAEADLTPRAWTTAQFDTYETRFDANWVGQSTNATGNQFGLTPQAVMALIFALPICIGAIIVSSMKWQKAEAGIVFSAIVILAAATMGWIPMALFATAYQMMAIYLSYIWFYARG